MSFIFYFQDIGRVQRLFGYMSDYSPTRNHVVVSSAENVAHPALRTGLGSEFVLAADQFIIHPAGRLEDAAEAHATGDEERTIIAGYHW